MIEVYLRDTKLEILNTSDLPEGKKFQSRFIQPGLAGYPQQYGNVLITKETLDKFVNTLEGKPVIINHQEVTTKNVADIEVGRVHNVWFDEKDGWYWCDGVLTSQSAVDLVKQGYSVSCSYNVSSFTDEGGTVNNIKYDMQFLDGVFTHLAIVKNPRYEDAEITVINSNDDDFVTLRRKDGSTYVVKLATKEDDIKSWSDYAKHIVSLQVKAKDSTLHRDVLDDVIKEASYEEEQKQVNKKTIQKHLGREDASIVFSKDGYRFDISKDNGWGYTIDEANKMCYRLNKSLSWVDATVSLDTVAQRRDDKTNQGYKVVVSIKNKGVDNMLDNEGRWITIKGNHIFLRGGETPEEGLKRFLKDKEDRDRAFEEYKSKGKEKKESIADLKSQEEKILKKYYEAKEGSSKREQLQHELDVIKEKRFKLEDESKKESGSLKGKYEDGDFDEEEAIRDIATVKEQGKKSIEEIAEYLGLDEDEVRVLEEKAKENEAKDVNNSVIIDALVEFAIDNCI